jgi:glycosyltransferase involved in cell wall biosynthesis
VNTDFFVPGKKLDSPIRVVFYTRHPTPRGVNLIVQGIKTFKSESPNQAVEFIGYDKNIFPQNIIESGVKFAKITSQQDLLTLLQSSHIIVSAMPLAGWNNVVAEGISCGMAALTTPAGTQDFVKDGLTGKIFKVGDEKSFIDGLRFYVENPEKLKQISRQGYGFIKKYSWVSFIDGFLKYLLS